MGAVTETLPGQAQVSVAEDVSRGPGSWVVQLTGLNYHTGWGQSLGELPRSHSVVSLREVLLHSRWVCPSHQSACLGEDTGLGSEHLSSGSLPLVLVE